MIGACTSCSQSTPAQNHAAFVEKASTNTASLSTSEKARAENLGIIKPAETIESQRPAISPLANAALVNMLAS
jgi:hypothetical protein